LNVDTLFWDLRWEEHAAWERSGLGRCSFAEYHARLDRAIELAYAQGCPVVLVQATVAEVCQELRAIGRDGDLDGLPEALLALSARRPQAPRAVAGQRPRGGGPARAADGVVEPTLPS
jgi:hypothetical protein